MAKKKEKSKKKDIEIIKEIKRILTEQENLVKGITSIELAKRIKSKKETIERYLEIFIILELVGKRDKLYFYQPTQFHSIPLEKAKEFQALATEIFHYAATGSEPQEEVKND